MQIQTTRETLVRALTVAKGCTHPKGNIPILGNVLLMGNGKEPGGLYHRP
jgi:DNA polymerase III sliding clamp (beta) subunit (PCNA family)